MSVAPRGVSALRGLSRRVVNSVAPVRGGGGGPVPCGRVATEALPEQDEYIWDDGTWNPEPCMDFNSTVSSSGAFWMLAGVMAGLHGLYRVAQYVDKPSFNPAERGGGS